MITMGDEVRRTQEGNNNAYCQDNEISWFDWELLKKHKDVHRFLKLIIERRLGRDATQERLRVSLNRQIREANIVWHGRRLNEPDWSDHSLSMAFTVELRQERLLFHVIWNAHAETIEFELPPVGNGAADPWRLWIDTSKASPNDIVPWREAGPHPGFTYRAEGRSVVVLFASNQ
jgi:isoamylase